jgi:hypothetical protein
MSIEQLLMNHLNKVWQTNRLTERLPDSAPDMPTTN